MKKKLIILLFFAVFPLASNAQLFWGGKTLNPKEVKEKWGHEKLDLKKFKEGSVKVKSSMAYSILLDKTLIGKSIDYIRNNLGNPDGFYFIDSYPAYLIQEGASHKEETWQIVFKLNEKYNVREVIVHKNCCE
ncbi:MAG: hypothetical protein J0M15_02975 [Deltaproteobacteria bacterium]|nr:hypothetical protein [Deltaproteobacteria bacterium]